MRTLLTSLLLVLQLAAFSQNTVWTAKNLKLSQDVAALADMTGATPAAIDLSASRGPEIPFANGFTFRYGLQQFDRFGISIYGYIKLGGPVAGVSPFTEDSVIAAFYTYSGFHNIKYKYLGTAPRRILVVEWSGMFTSTYETITFQLHLHEGNGKIQMLYGGSAAIAAGKYPYSILLRNTILDQLQLAMIDVRSDGSPAVMAYRTLPNTYSYISDRVENYEAIYPYTRLTIQPDTVKPAPPVLSFPNILPGCLSVKPEYDTASASVFSLFKLETTGAYRSLKTVFAGQSYSDTSLSPDKVYTYRGFTTNGFLNSDTITSSVRTPMPLIYGIKKIPGDYPSITALLEDAKCSHMGPELTIELQANYTFALEPAPVKFLPRHQNDFIRRITVQPAPGASLVLTNTAAAPLFTVDSVKFVSFDGRSGGVGTDRSLTIRQQDSTRPAIYYVNKADSGRIEYCIVDCINRYGGGLIQLSARDAYNSLNRYGVDGMVIRNCKIGPSFGTTDYAIVVEGNNGKGGYITIENNEFFRFRREAILMKSTRPHNKVLRNRFYQPEYIYTQSEAAIRLEGVGDQTMIEGNRFGGSAPEWGKGLWRTTSPGEYRFIQSTGTNELVIRNNEFANINLDVSRVKAVDVKGPVLLEGNIVGSTDSLRSFVGRAYLYPFWLNGDAFGRQQVRNNTFSGLYAGEDLVMLVARNLYDSVIVRDNDFGGSDNFHTNFANKSATGISTFPSRISYIRNNKVRGITARAGKVRGIDLGDGVLYSWTGDALVDSNQIHHLQGRQTVYGIVAHINSHGFNRASYNHIYALRAIGPSHPLGASLPAITCGIQMFNYLGSASNTASIVVHNNLVHSFEYLTPERAYWYSMVGLNVNSTNRATVYNNVLRLGTTANGAPVDSLETAITGIITNGKKQEIEHNSIYIGGTGTFGTGSTGISFATESNNTGEKTAFVSNNIIQIDRKEEAGQYQSYSSGYSSSGTANSIVSNNNLWYSKTDTSIATALRKWQAYCKCDANNVIADPLFINPLGDSATFSLKLQAGSSADGAGTPSFTAIRTDKDDRDRSAYTPVDIGAYAQTPCATAPAVSITLNPGTERLAKCKGGTQQLAATVSGSVKGLQWQKDLHPIAGATGTTITVTEPGTYRLEATLDCGRLASASVQVVDTAFNPQVDLARYGSTTPVCEGGRLTLLASVSGTTLPLFKWYKNDVLQVGKDKISETFDGVRANDLFKVEVLNQSACPSTITDTFRLSSTTPARRMDITVLSYRPTVCFDQADTVFYRITNVQPATTSIEFYPGSPVPSYRIIGDSLLVLQGLWDTTKLRIVSGVGQTCVVQDTSDWITVNVSAELQRPFINQSGTMLVSTSPVNNQWYAAPATAIPGATGQSFIPEQSGRYYVRLKQGDCVSDSSNTISYTVTSLPTLYSGVSELQVYPNPAKDKLWIRSAKLQGRADIALYDAAGREVLHTIIQLRANESLVISLPSLPSGLYTLRLTSRDKACQLKLFVDQ